MKRLLENKKVYSMIVLFIAILVMAVTNHEKTFLGSNQVTKNLFWNSEYLVYDSMVMSYQPGDDFLYGLGEMVPYNNGDFEYALTDEERGFLNGYSTTEKLIAVKDNEVTRIQYVEGHTLIFFNGDTAKVIESYPSGDGYLYVKYEADEIYSSKVQDSLKYLCIYNEAAGTYRQVGQTVPYESQVGLQGMIFSAFPKTFTVNQMITVYRWGLAFLYATVITFICYQIYKKYNLLFGVVFYAVTLLSPWMIGYSTNLYWVEFTWFLPMLAGLLCANHIDSRKHRILSYILVAFSIALKSACGYEYITTIMLSAIVFLLADFSTAIIERKDKKQVWLLFRTIFWMGIFALLGFAIVMIIHAYIRGGGNVYGGLRTIFYNDVLRRTIGGDASMFQDVYADSLNASVIMVVLRYLLFDTPIIFGVPGVLFIPLIALSFGGLIIGLKKGFFKKDMLALYIWLGIASVSWFVLGKSHSYVHTFMNFVMWYFGYVQIVFYCLIHAGRVLLMNIYRKRETLQ